MYNINYVKKFAINKGGQCLSNVYVNCDSKLRWQCFKGHTWKATWSHVKNDGSWCPQCRKSSIEEAKELASSRDGKCLSDICNGSKQKLRWQCSKGHVWETTLSSIKNGTWCPQCIKLSIEEMKELALFRGGQCLSDICNGSKQKLKWQCSKGHVWESQPSNVKSGHWCAKCCVKNPCKYTLDYVINFARLKGGECLSKLYNKTIDKLTWKCANNHVWDAVFQELLKGSWCPVCASNKLRLDLSVANKVALENFGKCLSVQYINTKSKLLWECELGHKWEATLSNVKDNNSWCPHCSNSYGEEKFRETIEKLTGVKFLKVKPRWLLNKNGNRMEIDGYNENLKLGFEYQGRQHSKFVLYFHKSNAIFKKRKRDDLLKSEILDEHGIKMLYPSYTLKPINYVEFILKEIGNVITRTYG